MRPTIGRIVHYRLNQEDADQINRRRTTGESIAHRIHVAIWPLGAQAHIGMEVVSGDIVAAVITAIHSDRIINLQALLDGSDTYWATSISFNINSEPGTWDWPPQV